MSIMQLINVRYLENLAKIHVSNIAKWDICRLDELSPGTSPGFSSRGGQKPEGGPHFSNKVMDYAATGRPNVKWGAPISNGGPGTTGIPAGDGPDSFASGNVRGFPAEKSDLTWFCASITLAPKAVERHKRLDKSSSLHSKKHFLVRGCGFFVSDVISEGILGHLDPLHLSLGPNR